MHNIKASKQPAMLVNEIQFRLDSIRPSSCCSDLSEHCYCPAYVGPLYGTKTRILFVGLDSGTSLEEGFPKTYQAKGWSDSVLGYRQQGEKRTRTWNPHYRGCVRTADAILKMDCEPACEYACRAKPLSACVLPYFSQTNAVKCVAPKKGMAFYAHNRIVECMGRNLFAEIEVLQPEVIVLQAKNRGSGHIHEDFIRELERAKWGCLSVDEENLVGTIAWTRGQLTGRKTVVAFFSHPSALGKKHFKYTWGQEILPSIPKIHALLAAIKS
jgi:hypothetical protein